MREINFKVKDKKIKLALGLVSLFILSLLFFNYSSAQTRPQIVITWSAGSYVPSEFRGKALPSPGTPVRVNMLVINNGLVADVSKREIHWSLDGEDYRSGTGMQRIEFNAPNLAGQFLKVRARIADFNGESLAKTIDIPIVRPEAIISTGFPGAEFETNNITLKAKAFFFNVVDQNSLLFNWKVNRQEPTPSGNPDVLLLSLPGIQDGYKIQVNLNIENDFPKESAASVKNLIYRR